MYDKIDVDELYFEEGNEFKNNLDPNLFSLVRGRGLELNFRFDNSDE